jgi:WD40 repeat protein
MQSRLLTLLLALSVGFISPIGAAEPEASRKDSEPGEGRSWKEQAVLKGHTQSVIVLAFAPNGATLVSGGLDGVVKVWDVAQSRERATLRGHRAYLSALAFAPDGKILTTLSTDGVLKTWDTETYREKSSAKLTINTIVSSAVSPDGKTLATTVGNLARGQEKLLNQVQLWDLPGGRKRSAFTADEMDATGVLFSPDDKTLLTCGSYIPKGSRPDVSPVVAMRSRIKLWSADKLKEVAVLPSGGVMAYAPDGKVLAYATYEKNKLCIKVVDMETRKEKVSIPTQTQCIYSMAFTPDSKLLASSSEQATVKLWDAVEGKEAATLKGHTELVQRVVFSPDGKVLASGSADTTVRLWAAK